MLRKIEPTPFVMLDSCPNFGSDLSMLRPLQMSSDRELRTPGALARRKLPLCGALFAVSRAGGQCSTASIAPHH
jgi:hypothetical protein